MTLKSVIEKALNKDFIKNLKEENSFHFQHLIDIKDKFIHFDISKERVEEITKAYQKDKPNFNSFLKNYEGEEREFLEILGEFISYIDNKATGKKKWNKYSDNRVLAESGVLHRDWVNHFLMLKMDLNHSAPSNIQNAFDYAVSPSTNLSILSESHRKLISNNILKKAYKHSEFTNDIISYFQDFDIAPKNNLNLTYILSVLLYKDSVKEHWTQNEVKKKEQLKSVPAYYCVGFHYEDSDPSNQLPRFVDNDIWENGYDDRFLDQVKKVPVDALIAAKTSYTMKEGNKKISVLKVHNIGRVINNRGDGRVLDVEWESEFKPFELKGKGAYRSTISQVHNKENINLIFNNRRDGGIISGNELNNEILFNGNLNKILYGPPGTGKTFKLQNEYFPLFTVDESTLSQSQFLENVVSDLTWWQVLAVALKDLGTAPVSEILTHPIIEAKQRLSSSKDIRPIAWSRLQAHTVEGCENVKVKQRSEPQIFFKEKNSDWKVDNESIEALYPEADTLIQQVNNYKPKNDEIIENYEFVTFHQSFSYEDFVEGIKPVMNGESSDITYEISKGVFKSLVIRAKNNPDQNFALFIDEINRGNISAIFGELISLIETDKRMSGDNPLKAKLPYSKEDFEVPSNLYIIGTMNTADRSVEALDTALRRRFVFEEIMPKPELLKNITFGNKFNLKDVLTTINDRIEALLDRDHTIGHSYFININSDEKDVLLEVFQNNVIPLLQEYFYHDYGKIELILGDGFIQKKESNIKFAVDSDYEPESNLIYQIKKVIDIEGAILKLLNR